MARTLTLAAIQFTPSDDMQRNIARVAGFIRDAAAKGADVVLPPELFCGHYFCKTQEEEHFARAMEWTDHPAVRQFSELAAELGVVIPVSIYEKDGPLYFNTVVMIDADGTPLGVYRKSHIPDGPGYQEKYYFRPGDTGFRTWPTLKGRIGVGICWDQWFPEAARAMALMGADALLYLPPSAPSRRMPALTPPPAGAAACRATRSPTSFRSWPQTVSAMRAARFSMARASSPTRQAKWSPNSAARKKAF